jgi:hypothetical protein
MVYDATPTKYLVEFVDDEGAALVDLHSARLEGAR